MLVGKLETFVPRRNRVCKQLLRFRFHTIAEESWNKPVPFLNQEYVSWPRKTQIVWGEETFRRTYECRDWEEHQSWFMGLSYHQTLWKLDSKLTGDLSMLKRRGFYQPKFGGLHDNLPEYEMEIPSLFLLQTDFAFETRPNCVIYATSPSPNIKNTW